MEIGPKLFPPFWLKLGTIQAVGTTVNIRKDKRKIRLEYKNVISTLIYSYTEEDTIYFINQRVQREESSPRRISLWTSNAFERKRDDITTGQRSVKRSTLPFGRFVNNFPIQASDISEPISIRILFRG